MPLGLAVIGRCPLRCFLLTDIHLTAKWHLILFNFYTFFLIKRGKDSLSHFER